MNLSLSLLTLLGLIAPVSALPNGPASSPVIAPLSLSKVNNAEPRQLIFSTMFIEASSLDLDQLDSTETERKSNLQNKSNLQKLINSGKARILATPNLSAQEGVTASAFIGDQIKYIKDVKKTDNGSEFIIDTFNAGITLKAIGTYEADGKILIKIHPEISTITGYNTTQDIGLRDKIQSPAIQTSYSDNIQRLAPGESLFIRHLQVPTTFWKNRKNLSDQTELAIVVRVSQEEQVSPRK